MTSIEDEYVHRTSRSGAEQGRLAAVMPGGDTRSVVGFEPYPLVLVSGQGGTVEDLDGNRYVDVLNNYTSLVHGHAHTEINREARRALEAGSVFPAPHQSQADLAGLLIERLPAVESVRFTNSGTEAAILALRLARHVTGRETVIMIEGGYHGTGESFADPTASVRRVPYNDEDALRRAMQRDVAAIFVEPFLGSAGVVNADRSFLLAVEAATRDNQALFVLDEIQALRNDLHGTHSKLGLAPDLVLLGKIIGGGLPIGAVGGRSEILRSLRWNDPRALAHSGTFNGNAVSMAAGRKSMELLTEEAIDGLNENAAYLQREIRAAAEDAGLTVVVTRAGSILHVHFLANEPTSYAEAVRSDPRASRLLHLALLNEGVFAAPRGMLNLSTAITSSEIKAVAEGYAGAFQAVRKEWREVL